MGTEGTWSWEEEATCEEPEEAGQGQALEGGEGRDNTSSVKHSEARLLQLPAAPPLPHTHTHICHPREIPGILQGWAAR